MPIQLVPILKALTPLVSSAGGLYLEWRKQRKPLDDTQAPPEQQLIQLRQRLSRLEELSAADAEVVAQLAEQLRNTAEQLQNHASATDRKLRRLSLLVLALLLLNLVLVGMVVMTQ